MKNNIRNIKKLPGRPQIYTPELGKEICNVIASTSKGTKRLCEEQVHWPCQDTLFTWLKIFPEFSEQYRHAKICQAELLVDELIDISDDISQDCVLDDSGQICYNTERVARSKLRIETRKWIAARLIPRVYGVKPNDNYSDHSMIKEELLQLRELLNKQYAKDY